ncbi:DUF5931 domain-containing protein [Kutzneria viridogrisea]
MFAVNTIWFHQNDYKMPGLAWLVAGVMTVWTGVLTYFYGREDGRRGWLVVTDLVLSCALMFSSIPIVGADQLRLQAPLITTLWSSGPVVAGAVHGGRTWGIVFGCLVAASNLFPRGYFDVYLAEDTVLLIGAGLVVGIAADGARRSAERVRQALRAEAAAAERERLARSIHDGVLQVLARVRRRGLEVGGEAAELAVLAGEQEIALRALIATGPVATTPDGETDLRPRLQLLTTGRTQISVPPTQVLVPVSTATELDAAVREALSNVDKHAGEGARAWVLLEDLGGELVLSIRDDGGGIPEGRLAAAEAEGHLGVSQSIRGRVVDLGGTVDLTTGPGEGTEWELRVPVGRTK